MEADKQMASRENADRLSEMAETELLNYAGHPFFTKKANVAFEFLKKAGLPKAEETGVAQKRV